MFSEGLMHGQGTYIWADGLKYEVKHYHGLVLTVEFNGQRTTLFLKNSFLFFKVCVHARVRLSMCCYVQWVQVLSEARRGH